MRGIVSKASERLRGAMVPALWCVMHTLWLAAMLRALFASSLFNPVGMSYPLWLIPLLLLGGYWLEHRVGHLWNGWLIGAGMGLGLVVAMILWLPLPAGTVALAERWHLTYSFVDGIPALLVASLATAIIWAMGLAAEWNDQQSLWRGFVAGVVALAVLSLVPSVAAGGTLYGEMAVFVFCGLLALALQSLIRVLAERQRAGGQGLERYWLLSLGIVTLGVIVLGALAALILTPNAVSQAAAIIWPIIRIILTPLFYVFQWIGYLLMLLLSAMLSGIGLTGDNGTQRYTADDVPTNLAQQLDTIERDANATVGLPPNLARIVLVTVIVGGLLLAFYLVWRNRWKQRQRRPLNEDREIILSRDMLVDQIREWLDSLRPRRGDLLYEDDLNAADPRHAIRLLYRRLLRAARRVGRPRGPGQTPGSFGRTLTALVPAERESIAEVTGSYMDVRYGDREPAPEHVAEVRGAVERIEHALDEREGR